MPSRRLFEICANQNLLTVTPETSVREAARRMSDRHVATVLVMTGEELVGIMSERDFVQRVIAPSLDPDVATVGDVMSPNPYSVDANRNGTAALQMMNEHGIRHVVVRDLPGGGYGVVSMRDFISSEFAEAEKVEDIKQELWEHV
ncbi:MAG: CBS domain-containing protein [Rhodospirillales bacterium]